MAEQAEQRLPLSRERILAAALALADEQGLDALSMRKLGQHLGFEAMSLYNHVANKDDLLAGLVDLVLGETEPPAPGADWAAAVRDSACSVHAALRRHRWAAGLLMTGAGFRPERIRYMDTLLGTLRRAGFSADTTYDAYHALDGHIFGFTLWENSHDYGAAAAGMWEAFERMIPRDEFPYLWEHGNQHFAEGAHRDVSAFEFGLDLILAGLKKIHAAESR